MKDKLRNCDFCRLFEYPELEVCEAPSWETEFNDKYELVIGVTTGLYNWHAEALIKRKVDGQLFLVRDSGCSCYNFYDLLDSWAFMEPVYSIDEALRKSVHKEKMRSEAMKIR